MKNWKAVLLSIVGAATFWFFNALNKDYTARINYPIEFLFEQDSVVVMEPLPTTVTVDVSSGGWNLIRKTFLFNITPIRIELDNPTEISYYTRASLFPLVTDQLSGIEVTYLVTDTIHINIEEKLTKKVLLRVDSLSVPLEESYRITSPITVSSDTVELTGPKSFIDSLKSVYTFRMRTREIDDPFSGEVEVSVPNPQLIIVNPPKVNISFQVERFEEFMVKVPIETVNFPRDSSVWISQNFVEVRFLVPRSRRDTYSEDDFAVTADLSMRRKADSTVMVMLIFYPEEITDPTIFPENLKLTYE